MFLINDYEIALGLKREKWSHCKDLSGTLGFGDVILAVIIGPIQESHNRVAGATIGLCSPFHHGPHNLTGQRYQGETKSLEKRWKRGGGTWKVCSAPRISARYFMAMTQRVLGAQAVAIVARQQLRASRIPATLFPRDGPASRKSFIFSFL